MRICGREIGDGWPPYVIAELGVNHDGSVDRALSLVEMAARAGADAVKVQLFRGSMLMSGASRLASYQAAAGESDPVAMLGRLELGEDELGRIAERARVLGLHAIATVFSVGLVEVAESIGFDAYKTASPDVVHKPLLDRLSSTGKPLIVSTGAATMDEVRRAVGWLGGAAGDGRLAVLHCVSSYPAAIDDATLGGVAELGKALGDGVVVGYSDHTESIEAGAYAVCVGASVLEKHVTHDRRAAGPDHAASLEEGAFLRYAHRARRAWLMMGESKRVSASELDVRTVSRQSLVSTRRIEAGEVIEVGMLTVKRPGTGLEPWMLEEVVGRRAVRAIELDVPLVGEDVGLEAGVVDGATEAA